MSNGRLTRALLLLLNVVLVATIWLLWQGRPQYAPEAQLSEVKPQPLVLPPSPLRTLPLEHYRELTARPLFWSERRAQQSAAPAEVAVSTQPLSFVLLGVVMSSQSKHALLGKTGSSEVAKVQPGDILEGWEVESMSADSVSLRRGPERRLITLDEKRTTSR